MEIGALLKPDKICVIGASEKSGFGGDTCRNVIEYMREGSYYFVNPRRDEVFGKPCYRTVEEVPGSFDLAVICTPQGTVEELLKSSRAKGARAAVVFASGYKEIGSAQGRENQERLSGLCRELDMALMGPNCAGFVNYTDGVYPFAFLSESRDRKGAVGVVSQSGQICLSLMDSPGMRFSYVISSGNSAVVRMEDYLEFLVEDESTKVVAMYLEGVQNVPQFLDCLKRAAMKRKPVVILKAGRSEKGSRLAASHTGSLSGADAVFDAVFRKYGVIRVDDVEELMAVSMMLSVLPGLPKRPGIASMNLSGGETGVCADVGQMWGIEYPDFQAETLERLREQLPSYASPANPLDMTATLSYDVQAYAGALRTVMSDPNVGLVAVGYTLLERIADPAICYMTEAIELVAAEPGAKPMVMIPFLENTRNEEYARRLERAGVPVLPPTVYAFKILRYLEEFAAYRPEELCLDMTAPAPRERQTKTALTEHESKVFLRGHGIETPRERVARSEAEALEAAGEYGYPVVLKIDSGDIMHKSDAGCVKVGIQDEGQLRQAYGEILDNAKAYDPQAVIGGVLVQEMLKAGTEVIIGVNNDPQFGPMVMCGLGGVFVEIFKDVSMAMAPVSEAEALKMLRSLKGYKLFTGYRGGKKLDEQAVADLIVRVSRMAADEKDCLAELDINPVFVYEAGVALADALVLKYN